MTGSHDPSKTRGRRSIDAAQLAAAAARQRAADTAEPVAAVTTLMGAIRMFAPLIATRREHGFTDPQIVTMLRTNGIDISVDTLRVYRRRLRLEGGKPDLPPPPTVVPVTQGPPPHPTAGADAEPASAATPGDRPASFNRTITLEDGV